MGRFSLSLVPLEREQQHEEEDENRLERYAPDEDIQPCAPSALNPIYVYYHPQRHRRISVWWYIVGAVLVAHVVARYGPPAPPPTSTEQTLSWHDFFRQEGTRLLQSLTTLGSVIPHVWHWCVVGIRQEVRIVYDHWTQPPPCPIVLDESSELHIVGQSKAVSMVSDALEAWNQHSPLFLLLTGTDGVGKLELALQVARRVFGDCNNALLELDAQNDNADLITTRVLNLIQRQQGSGAIVILRHAQELSSRAFLDLLQLLIRQERVVFVSITGIGTRTIHQHLKQDKSMERIPKVELELTIRDEIDDYFDADVAKYFHAIAPFVPIGQVELQEILQLHVDRIGQQQAGRQWKSLVMTDELAEALVDPSQVEYIEWKDKNTGETILVFSGAGADVIKTGSPIMNKVTAQIKRCLSTATPDLVGKLDYDPATREGVVSWCVGSSSSCYESCRFSLD